MRTPAYLSFLFCVFLFNYSTLYGQTEFWTSKHFLDVGYGYGKSNWYSQLDNYEMLNKEGSVVKSGDLTLKAKNNISIFHFDVSFPLERIRLGMGISFTQLYIDKVNVESASSEPVNIVFDEQFAFNKMYAVLEVPVYSIAEKILVTAKSNIGYFNHYGLQTIDFFGRETGAKKYFISTGISGTYRIYPHLFVFVYPYFEYMQLKNISSNVGSINHKIITGSVIVGLRIDLSDE